MHLCTYAYTFHIAQIKPIKFLASLPGIGVFTNIDTKKSFFTLYIVSLVLFSFYILLWLFSFLFCRI